MCITIFHAGSRILVFSLACLGLGAPAFPQAAPDLPAMNAQTRAAIIDSVSQALTEIYVFPDAARVMVELMQERLAAGDYDRDESPVAFCERLHDDMQSVYPDGHLGVRVEPPDLFRPFAEPANDQERERLLARLRSENFGFKKLERLPGNIGYLKLDSFVGAELGGATAVAAMNFLAHSDALIFDLRENGGGSPSMIQLLTSYLLEEPTHLNSFYIRRSDETKQFWTQAHVEGVKMTELPVYVLTSGSTFSGAEEFTYNLKNLERATIIGETTGGGAHPTDFLDFDFGDYVVGLSVPFGRAVNPITGTNWEGTGGKPQIHVSPDDALAVAQVEALKSLERSVEDEDRRFELTWARRGLEARLNPVVLTGKQLKEYAGSFGPRRVILDGGELYYQREDRPRYRLRPMGDDTFLLDGLDRFRLKFDRDAGGRVTAVTGLYDSGYQDRNEKSG